MPDRFTSLTASELVDLDAALAEPSARWNAFYADRARPCPFFGKSADESLAEWVEDGSLPPGRAIDLGCGHARNAIFLARHGFDVEAVDYSKTAIDWARERVAEAGVTVALKTENVFDLELEAGAYDLVYDSGCFHHLPPHRRSRYVDLVVRALKPGGHFGMTCFRPEGGSGYTDDQVYERRSLGGGLGYTQAQLRGIWSPRLDVRVFRQMKNCDGASGLFGEDFLWVMRARKA